jgi:hypothetical protein
MVDQPKLPTKEDLMKLPLRAIVAFAARSARRVQPLYDSAVDIPDFAEHKAAVDKAILLAEGFCLGLSVSDAVNAAAAEAAEDTAGVDYARLLELKQVAYPHLGQTIDPTEKGPLGPLWPKGRPMFPTNSQAQRWTSNLEATNVVASVLEVFIDPGSASKEAIQEVLEALSDLNREAGGLGLEFSIDGLFVMAREKVLV